MSTISTKRAETTIKLLNNLQARTRRRKSHGLCRPHGCTPRAYTMEVSLPHIHNGFTTAHRLYIHIYIYISNNCFLLSSKAFSNAPSLLYMSTNIFFYPFIFLFPYMYYRSDAANASGSLFFSSCAKDMSVHPLLIID